MKNTPSAESQVALDRHKSMNPPTVTSEGATPDQGAAPLVGTGERVGLGSESVGYLVSTWLLIRLDEIESAIKDAAKNEDYRTAHELGLKWTAYNSVRAKLGTELAAAKMCQPQPNFADEGRAGNAASKPI